MRQNSKNNNSDNPCYEGTNNNNNSSDMFTSHHTSSTINNDTSKYDQNNELRSSMPLKISENNQNDYDNTKKHNTFDENQKNCHQEKPHFDDKYLTTSVKFKNQFESSVGSGVFIKKNN